MSGFAKKQNHEREKSWGVQQQKIVKMKHPQSWNEINMFACETRMNTLLLATDPK